MTKTLLVELRDAAKECSNVDYRSLLRQTADSLSFSMKALYDDPTTDRMIDLNGAWAHANRVLSQTPPEAPPAPMAGSPEPARLAA